MARSLGRIVLGLVALAVVLTLVGRFTTPAAPTRVTPETPGAEELPSIEPPSLARAEPLPSPSPDPSPAERPTVVASSPPASVDPCEEVEREAPIDRPSLGALIRDRVDELNDRMRAAMRRPTSSASLREGLRLATDPARADEALSLLASAPDRVEDGFDLRVAVLVVLAANALGDDDRRARTLALTAHREAPDDPLPLALEALADEHLGDDAGATEALRAAHALDPSEPSIALPLGQHLRDGPDPAAAVAVLDGYLAEVPGDTAVRRTRERLARRAAAMRDHRVSSRGGVSIVAPTRADRAAVSAALEAVDAGLSRAARLLGVERPAALTILVYESGVEMQAATCGRSWSSAMYDGALHVPASALGTADGALALRHESLHATLHRALPSVRVPTWLDEGLAQYASGEWEGDPGVRRSFRLMAAEHAVIPFASMDGAFLVIDDPTDARLAYHQALAMVLWLVDRRGERGVADAIAHLASGGAPERVLSEAARVELTPALLEAFVGSR